MILRDAAYGVGFPIHHNDVLNKDKWNGGNELDNALMTVRDSLKYRTVVFILLFTQLY